MLDIRAQALGSNTGEILLYGDIVDTSWERWSEEDTTPKLFNDKLQALGTVAELRVRINCYGGSVFAGRAMGAMLDTLKKAGTHVVTVIEGVAASMAAALFQYGDERIMWDGTMMMNHKPLARSRGNADDHRKVADILDKSEQSLIQVYMRHFNGTEDELRALLRQEEWLTAEEAFAYGFCSQIEGAVQVAAHAGGYAFGELVVPTAFFAQNAGKIKITEQEGGEKGMLNNNASMKPMAGVPAGGAGDPGPAGQNQAGGVEDLTVFLTAEQVQAAVGFELGAEKVLAVLKNMQAAGFDLNEAAESVAVATLEEGQVDPELIGKAVAYDAIVAKAKDEALTNGVKAKGEDFSRERWGKVLDTMTLDEIEAMGAEWAKEAGETLHAGERHSETPRDQASAPVVNPQDYVF